MQVLALKHVNQAHLAVDRFNDSHAKEISYDIKAYVQLSINMKHFFQEPAFSSKSDLRICRREQLSKIGYGGDLAKYHGSYFQLLYHD